MPAPEATKHCVVDRRLGHHPAVRAIRATFDRFFSERGTHLAAMVAYFALASFVPLIFLALSVLGFLDQADSSSALVSYLEDVFPDRSVESIVNVVDAVQRNATTLSVVGAVALLWSSLSLFSALESAFNILYGRPNRPFLRGKALAIVYMSAALVVLFAGLTVGDVRLRPAPPLRERRRREPVGGARADAAELGRGALRLPPSPPTTACRTPV